MNPNKFNFGKNDAYGDSWSEISTKEEELKKQLENLQAQKEDIRAYEAFQDAAAFDNLENIKRTNPEFGIDALEQYAETIQGLKELLNEIPVMHESRAGTPEANKYESRRQELQKTIALKERILGKKLAKNNQEFGSRAEIVSDYFNNMFGKDLTADIELPEPESNKAFGPEPAPEQLIGLNGEELEKEVPLQKETPEEKIRRLGEALGWSDEEINKRIDAFNNSREANHDEDKKVDNPPTSLEEQFDEAVRNGASAQELAKISHKFYKEGQFLNGGKLELSEEYRDRYEIMRRVISAQREFERGQNGVDSKERRGLLDKMLNSKIGKRVLGIVGLTTVAGFVIAGLNGAFGEKVDNQNTQNKNTDPQTEQTTDGDSVQKAVDEFNKFASDSDTEANLEIGNNNKYDRENDTFYKFDNKESRGSIGTSIETVKDDQYIDYLKNNTEDNLSFKGQFFRMNEELAQTLLGVNAEGVEALVDAAEKGDQAAFEKLDKAYDILMSEAKLSEGQRALGDQFDSIYRVQEADGTWTYKHADDLNIGGTYRTISTVINGKTYTFDLRDQCTQLILRDIVVEIPAIAPTEYSNFVEPKTPTPINEVPDNPDNPGENPNETPENPDDKKLESKDPKVDINVNPKLNPEVKSEVKDNTVNTNVGNQYEYKAQDADQNMTYGSSNYIAPPVENFYREDKAENTIADLSQATPQEVIEATPSVDETTGESTLTESQQETGDIVDNSSNTYKVEVNYSDTFEQSATPDVNIDDSTRVKSLNGAADQNGSGSNIEQVNGF